MANNRDIIPSQGGALKDLMLKLKLIVRLMGDRRVSLWVKLLPIGALAYVLSPVDLVPGLAIPVIGVVDDMAILWLGTTMFIELCPPDVVAELSQDLTGSGSSPDSGGEVIDGEVTDISQDEK